LDVKQDKIKRNPSPLQSLWLSCDALIARSIAQESGSIVAHGEQSWKIVVIGGSGLIGKQLVNILRQKDTKPSRRRLRPASYHSPARAGGSGFGRSGRRRRGELASFEDKAVLRILRKIGRNLLAARAAAGVDITSRCPSSAPTACRTAAIYEQNWPKRRSSNAPAFPTRSFSTQFFRVHQEHRRGRRQRRRHPPVIAQFQPSPPPMSPPRWPISWWDSAEPHVEVAVPNASGSMRWRGDFWSATATASGHRDADALYFGTRLDDNSLTAGDQARSADRFEDWLGRAAA